MVEEHKVINGQGNNNIKLELGKVFKSVSDKAIYTGKCVDKREKELNKLNFEYTQDSNANNMVENCMYDISAKLTFNIRKLNINKKIKYRCWRRIPITYKKLRS
jgi:hypothetical protein